MAILSKEKMFDNIKAIIGDNTSDEALQLLEDFNDTYDDLNGKKGTDNSDDWKARYEENDKMWRQKYRDRFFSATGDDTDPITNPTPVDNKTEEEKKAETITVNDLFTLADKKE